ncbi:MAG: sugar phosphate isomerase/epimerase, partial [Pseudomonadales bacterium]
IEEHKMWQCQYAGVGMIPPKTYLSMTGLTRFLEELRPIAARLATHDIRFVYHNHHHEFQHFDGKPWLAHLYDRTPNDEVMAEFDTHWIVAGGGDPVAWIDGYADRIAALHLKDFALNANGQRVFAPVGKGNLNWPAILEATKRQGIGHCYVEQDNCYGRDEFDCLEQSFRYLSPRLYS